MDWLTVTLQIDRGSRRDAQSVGQTPVTAMW